MCCISHTGKVRMKNEDNFFFHGAYLPQRHGSMEEPLLWTADSKDRPLIAVFDGMGGENEGDLASYTAARTLCGLGQAAHYSRESLTDALRRINRKVCETRHERRMGQIGTTAVLFGIEETHIWIADLGDSPAFRFRKGSLSLLSQPHTNARFIEEQGIMRKPALTQFLGIDEEEFLLEPFVSRMELEPGDIYMLCSDGLTDMLPEKSIRDILENSGGAEDAQDKLIRAALERGGRDNITVILCEVKEKRGKLYGGSGKELSDV